MSVAVASTRTPTGIHLGGIDNAKVVFFPQFQKSCEGSELRKLYNSLAISIL